MANLYQAHLTIVPAAGQGTRLGGDVPKAWVDLAGAPLVCTTLRRLSEGGGTPAIVLVADPPKPQWRDPTFYRAFGCDSVEKVVPGGATRHESVVRGLRSFPLDANSIVLIHDAARPMVAASDVQAVLRAAFETGAAVGGWPLADTMKRLEPGAMRLGESVPREGLFAVATPQAFRYSVLEDAIRKAGSAAKQATDEASLVQAAGHPVAAVPISRYAFKVTFPEELADAERIARLESDPALAH